MHRATWRTIGTLGIGLLAVFLMLGLTGAAVLGSGTSHATARSADSGVSAATAHPDTTNTWVNADNITYAPAPYTTIPTWVNVTLAYGNFTGTVGPSNLNLTLQIYDDVTHKVQSSIPATIVSGQLSYAITLNATTMGCPISDSDCTNTLIDNYELSLFVTLNGTSGGGNVGSNETAEFDVISFITYTPVFNLVAPVTSSVEAGNITLSVAYHAQYITAVSLNIYNATADLLVYSSSFLQNSTGISVAKVWYYLTAGTFDYSIAGTTPYATLYTNGSFVITPQPHTTPVGGGTVYQNTTITNTTVGGTSTAGYFGLSPAASGTVLLIVGLIVGIIAGMVAARMMMSNQPAKPAQPWSDNKGTAANTCSVCGKSFGSADELAAHSKSEHGMQ